MATARGNYPGDSSSIGNFRAWASAPGIALASFGWKQADDTGQAVWISSVVAITAAAIVGTTTTYTYTLSSGPALRVGMSLTITGMADAGNNGTFTITALGAGTFSVVNAGGVNRGGQAGTGATTAQSVVGAVTVYEVWRMDDTLQGAYPVFMKLTFNAINSYAIWNAQIGTGTNGAGTLSNATSSMGNSPSSAGGAPLYDCLFSGDAGRFQMCLFRNCTAFTNIASFLSVERSVDTSGNPTGDFVYIQTSGYASGAKYNGQMLTSAGSVLTLRTVPELCVNADSTSQGAGYVSAFAITPVYGYQRNPLLGQLRGCYNDWTELDNPPVSIYAGISHNYIIVGKAIANLAMANVFGSTQATTTNVIIMRYD